MGPWRRGGPRCAAAVVAGVFPDAPIHSPGTLTAIVTMQCSQVELAGDGGTGELLAVRVWVWVQERV